MSLKDYFDIIENEIDSEKPISNKNMMIGKIIIKYWFQKRLMKYEQLKQRLTKWIRKEQTT